MKQIITLLCLSFFLPGIGFSQYVPMGMKYQAVARDTKGQILANQELQLNISLYADAQQKDILYLEVHETTTTELGLFTLTIGEGTVTTGRFEAIPWSSKEIWMEVAIRTDDATEFISISNSKMLSVPYAFHAATADEWTGDSNDGRGGSLDPNPSSKNWLTLGNAYTDPSKDKLGTIDSIDMNFVTHNRVRMRITADGHVRMENNLTVNRNVYLNTNIPTPDQPDIQPAGKTINFGDFTVENGSLTRLTGDVIIDGVATVVNQKESINPSTGALVVEGGAGIARNLNVGGAFGLSGDAIFKGLVRMTNLTESTGTSKGALVVDGGVGIGKNLNVGGATTLNNILNVSGATSLNQTLNVNGATTLNNSLTVTKNDEGFVAKITNTNAGNGDGLEIKLGRTHPAWDGNDYLHMTSPGTEFVSGATATVKGWITGQPFEVEDILTFIPDAWIAGTTCELYNQLKGSILEGLGLPLTTRDIAIALNGHDPVLCRLKEMKAAGSVDWEDSHIKFSLWVPPYNTAAFQQKLLDKVDEIDCPSCWDNNTTCEGFDGLLNDDDLIYDTKWFSIFPPQLDFIPTGIPGVPQNLDPLNLACSVVDLPHFDLPNINLLNVDNSLTTENQFISFKDANDKELGSIHAQSVLDWEENYLNSNLVQIVCGIVGLDITSGIAFAIGQMTAVADSYNSIGVEYASGHGDYAEWLERMDHDEIISNGDIVAVAGGKITKDLSKAEQVMAVSAKPIMLGNSPSPEEEPNGNKIAFMGQIPVKIIGPVSSGDYIVGNALTPGYGIAVRPADITSAQAHLVVGRSWDTNLNRGPKMINTVIGVDNGSFLKILQESRTEMTTMDARVSELEAKLEMVMTSVGGYAEVSSKKSKTKNAN